MAHTPGPWELDGVEIYPVAGHRAIDAICEMKPGFSDADARLIAAAPAMADLLRELSNWLVCGAIAPPEDMAQSFSPFRERIDVLLLNATGAA